tara:strand:+ start:1250 stop:1534 length:285 start_codon:yes stop_codon:yes gene_type:complete
MVLSLEGLRGPSNPSNEVPMPYVILKGCMAAGQRRSAGDVVDLGQDEANNLISMGRAAKADAPSPKPADRSVGLKKSDAPAVKKRIRRTAKKAE